MMKKYNENRTRKIVVVIAVVLIAVVIAGGYDVWKKQAMWKVAVSNGGGGDTSKTVDSGSWVTYNNTAYEYNDHLSNFLVMGVDREHISENTEDVRRSKAGQADVIFLISWNRTLHTVAVITIPRDTMAEIEAFNISGDSLGKTRDHINLAFAYGDGKSKSCELMKAAVSDLFYGLKIQGYCAVGLDSIPVLAKAVDTVTLTVPDDSLSAVNPEWTEGAEITLDAESAESFVRYRNTDIGQSAMNRMDRQLVFLKAWGEKASTLCSESPSMAADLYEALDTSMVTNIGKDQFVKMWQDIAGSSDSVTYWTVPGESVEGDQYDEYHVDDAALYEKIIETFYREVD